MNPILLGRHVEQGLRELVHSTLNSTSAGFEGAVDRFLKDSEHLMKGPWVSVDLPFKSIGDDQGNFAQPFPDIPLQFAPYQHQVSVFERLTGAEAKSTLIATGTGSGKTESYLWPILDYCRQHANEPGIKAILIFPMNALATDQARRVAKAITSNTSLAGVTAGIYADSEPKSATYDVTSESIITSRDAMRKSPPDILLTNYKMLDYLLLRGNDLPLWSANQPKTLRFLVVDELHTFDGAQGADLALLIRRLKHRLKTPEDQLICVGSSATLGTSDEAAVDLVEYAQTIFGEPFVGDAVIRETRETASDALDEIQLLALPEISSIERALGDAQELDQAQAAYVMSRAFFAAEQGEERQNIDALFELSPESAKFRIALGSLLKQSQVVSLVIEALSRHQGPMSLQALADRLKQRSLSNWSESALRSLVEVVISLICWARSGSLQGPRPLFNTRLQIWLREMARIVAKMPRSDEEGEIVPASLHHADDLDNEELQQVLPVVNCQRCGTSAFLGREGVGSTSLGAPLETLYKEFFEDNSADRLRLIYTNELQDRHTRAAGRTVYPGLLAPDTLAFQIDERQLDRTDSKIPVWLYLPAASGRMDRTCPACGHSQGLVLFGIRSARLTASMGATLYTSEQNEEAPSAKPRFLMFSDSVQDAAQRSAVTEVRNAQSVTQKAIYKNIQGTADSNTDTQDFASLGGLIESLPSKLVDELGANHFVSAFIPRDQWWRRSYQALATENTDVTDRDLLRHVQARVGWSVFEDFTYKSHLISSLEGRGIASCDVAVADLQETAKSFQSQLGNNCSVLADTSVSTLTILIFGVLQRLRRQGSVVHPYLERAIEGARTGGYLNWFGAAASLGWGRGAPSPDARRALAPIPAGFHDNRPHFANIARDSSTNPYIDWLYRGLIGNRLSTLRPWEIYQLLFDRLVQDGWLKPVTRNGAPEDRPWGYLLESERIGIGLDVTQLECDVCNRRDLSLIENAALIDKLDDTEGLPCSRIGCKGKLRPGDLPQAPALLRSLASDRNHRVVAREHTGLLDTDTRLAFEEGFIRNENPWAPNLISATPTLEMGIDIGDLSTMLLCSVPPEEANYVQRMGRTGRRDGNALNLVLANARPHDLQFWTDPSAMLKGEVRAPGVYIAAESVLIRQITAFTLDAYVAQTKVSGDYGKVADVRKRRQEESPVGFPMDWLAFVADQERSLADAFVDLLPDSVRVNHRLISRLKDYVLGPSEGSLQWTVLQTFDDADAHRARLVDKRGELTEQKRLLRKRAAEIAPEELKRLEDAIEKDRKEINRLIRQGIDNVPVIKFLTDKGCLPNYAFPEEGVTLTSLLSRREGSGSEDDGLTSIEYQRPASSALSEFALGQTFYAEGRQVEISRLDMSAEDLSQWRFCQTCSYAENTAVSDDKENCPACGDDMWSDSGSLQSVIDLKSVLAISSEERSAIRDNDQRAQLAFDRSMIPDYAAQNITSAWYADDENSISPFGYELIAQCTFRDFNFGKKEEGPVGPCIAGQNRFSRPFRLCKHCGTKQSDFLGTDEVGEHPPSCPVIKLGIEAQDEWLIRSFLKREFSTEAIRLIIPVVGEINHDEVKSFVAGINLGMRHFFKGKVDHIRSAVVEGQLDGLSTVRSLFLYDSVPGGSGYLRQLVDDSRAMKAVFDSAFRALDTCPCIREEKTGCYRCVKSYRSQFGPGEPFRDTARNLIESVLNQWDSLKKAKKSLNAELSNTLISSELEKRFLQALRNALGDPNALTPQVVGQGVRGFMLSIDGKPSWTIEPQVQLQSRFPGMPKKQIDFLMTPIGAGQVKPIVIEMDGIKYHAGTVSEDLRDRLQMLRSGYVTVWTLSWFDLQEQSKPIANPLLNESFSDASRGTLGSLLGSPEFAAEKAAIERVQSHGSLSILVGLIRGEPVERRTVGLLFRGIIGRGQPLVELRDFDTIRQEAQMWLEESPLGAKTSTPGLDIFMSAQLIHPDQFVTKFDDIRVLVDFTAPLPTESAATDEAFNTAFRGLWRTVNIGQFLPGFHVQYPDADTLDIPARTRIDTARVEDAAWKDVKINVLAEYLPLVNALMAADIGCPDRIGEDVMDGQRVIAMAEMGWSDHDLWVSDSPLEDQPNIVSWDLSIDSIPNVIATLTERMRKGNNVI